MNYIIELEKGVFIATWDGDPGRTLFKETAKTFSKKNAEKFSAKIKEKYTGRFINVKILNLNLTSK